MAPFRIPFFQGPVQCIKHEEKFQTGHWKTAIENQIPWTKGIPGLFQDILIRILLFQDNLTKLCFSRTFPGHSRTAIIFQVFKVFQDVWEPWLKETLNGSDLIVDWKQKIYIEQIVMKV